jgi:hypothetical protein
MKRIKGSRMKPFFLAIIFGIFMTFVSALHRYEYNYPRDVLLPCILKVFHIPLKEISYGLPFFWLVCVEEIDQIGCGPTVGYFSTYFIQWLGLFADLVLYAFCSSVIICFHHKLRAWLIINKRDTNYP